MILTDALLWKPSPQQQRRHTTSSLLFLGDSFILPLRVATAYYLRCTLKIGVAEGGLPSALNVRSMRYAAGFGRTFLRGRLARIERVLARNRIDAVVVAVWDFVLLYVETMRIATASKRCLEASGGFPIPDDLSAKHVALRRLQDRRSRAFDKARQVAL